MGRDIWRDRRALGRLAFFRPGGRGGDARRPKAARQPRSDYVWREGDCRGSDNAKWSICRHRMTNTNFIAAFLDPSGSPKEGRDAAARCFHKRRMKLQTESVGE